MASWTGRQFFADIGPLEVMGSYISNLMEERYHVLLLLDREAGMWRLDLSLWLHDLHQNVTAVHEALRDSIIDEPPGA